MALSAVTSARALRPVCDTGCGGLGDWWHQEMSQHWAEPLCPVTPCRRGDLAGGDMSLHRAAFRGGGDTGGHAPICHPPCPRLGWAVLGRRGLVR